MLNKLPYEIIISIADHLTIYSRLQIVLTCHKLYDIMHSTRMVDNVKLLLNNKQTVLQQFENKKMDGSKVKKISIQFLPTGYQFLLAFPKVQEIWVSSNPQRIGIIYKENIEQISFLKDTIQKYDNRYSLPEVTLLMKKYTFENLVDLALDKTYINHNAEPISYVQQTPLLVSLKLCSFDFGFEFLENLHSICTRLKTLELDKMHMNLFNQVVPEPLFPAVNLESFRTGTAFYLINDSKCRFMQYLIEKYTNLVSLDLNNWLDLPHLTARRGFVSHVSSNTYKSYRRRLPGFMMEIIPRLTTLKIEPYLFNNYIATMNTIPTQLTELCIYNSYNRYDLFDRLKHHQFIQSFGFLTSISVEIKYAKFLYHKRASQPNIKQLHLFQNSSWLRSITLELNRLLFSFNSLSMLDINCPYHKISITEEQDAPQHLYLNTMFLCGKSIDDNVCGYIRRSLLNLNTLSWKTKDGGAPAYKFKLPDHDLHVLNIHVYTEPYQYSYNSKKRTIKYDIKKEDIKKTVHLCIMENSRVGELSMTDIAVKEDPIEIVPKKEHIKADEHGSSTNNQEIKVSLKLEEDQGHADLKEEKIKVEVVENNTPMEVGNNVGSTLNDAIKNEGGIQTVEITCKNLRCLKCGDIDIF